MHSSNLHWAARGALAATFWTAATALGLIGCAASGADPQPIDDETALTAMQEAAAEERDALAELTTSDTGVIGLEDKIRNGPVIDYDAAHGRGIVFISGPSDSFCSGHRRK